MMQKSLIMQRVAEPEFTQEGLAGTAEQDVCERHVVRDTTDIVGARLQGRVMAQELGCTSTQATLVATIISELARNIILYAGSGEILLGQVKKDKRNGILIIALDKGPGIASTTRAMMSGYSTSGGLGLGLPGVKQMADEFSIHSIAGEGTRVSVKMWLA